MREEGKESDSSQRWEPRGEAVEVGCFCGMLLWAIVIEHFFYRTLLWDILHSYGTLYTLVGRSCGTLL